MHLRVLFVLVSSTLVRCANILGFFPAPSHSHQAALLPIMKHLSLRGHNVTVYTTHPLKDPSLTNLTEVSLENMKQFSKKKSMSNVLFGLSHFEGFRTFYDEIVYPVSELAFEHPKVQELLKDEHSKYDIVLVDPFPTAFYALGNKFRCPVISTLSLEPFIPFHESIGNPIHPVLYPDTMSPYIGEMSFQERLMSTFGILKILLYYHVIVIPRFDAHVKRYFGEDVPYLGDIERNISLMFTNVNPAFNVRRPNVPAIIEVNYLHIKPKKDLPKDLKQFLDDAKEGVVYMSLGSNIMSAHLPKDLLNVLIQTFSELPYQVLWKFENDTLPGLSKNVLLRKWLPQQDLLGHPNIKVFITQGGFQSAEETILNKVPTVVLPFFNDQKYNCRRMEHLGIGKCFNPTTLTKTQLKSGIQEVIENPRYQEKITELSRLSLDQPMTGLEKAIWWTEYVIRNKGAQHLRSPYLSVPLYQSYFLDIFLFILVLLSVMYYLVKLSTTTSKVLLSILVLLLSYLAFF